MTKLLRKLWNDQEGASMVEYGLLVALIAMVAAVAITTTGTDLGALFGRVNTNLAG